MAIILVAGPIHARQVGSLWDPRRPYISEQEIPPLVEELALTGDQTLLVEAMTRHFITETKVVVDEWTRVRAEDIELRKQSDGDATVRGARLVHLRKRDLALVEEVIALQRALDADIQLVLEEDQVEAWLRFLRTKRRNASVAVNVRLDRHPAAQEVDVVRLAHDMLPEESLTSTEVSEILDLYEAQLDRFLIARNDLFYQRLKESYLIRIAQLEGTYVDPLEMGPRHTYGMNGKEVTAFGEKMRMLGIEQQIEQYGQSYEASLRIADLNRLTLARLVAILPLEEAEAFKRAFAAAAYPDLYEDSLQPARFNGHIYFATVLNSDLLTGEQRVTIGELSQGYFEQFDMIADRLARLRDREESEWEDRLRENLDPSIGKDRERFLALRRQLQETTITQVQSLIVEQRDVLKPASDPSRW